MSSDRSGIEDLGQEQRSLSLFDGLAAKGQPPTSLSEQCINPQMTTMQSFVAAEFDKFQKTDNQHIHEQNDLTATHHPSMMGYNPDSSLLPCPDTYNFDSPETWGQTREATQILAEAPPSFIGGTSYPSLYTGDKSSCSSSGQSTFNSADRRKELDLTAMLKKGSPVPVLTVDLTEPMVRPQVWDNCCIRITSPGQISVDIRYRKSMRTEPLQNDIDKIAQLESILDDSSLYLFLYQNLPPDHTFVNHLRFFQQRFLEVYKHFLGSAYLGLLLKELNKLDNSCKDYTRRIKGPLEKAWADKYLNQYLLGRLKGHFWIIYQAHSLKITWRLDESAILMTDPNPTS